MDNLNIKDVTLLDLFAIAYILTQDESHHLFAHADTAYRFALEMLKIRKNYITNDIYS